MSSETPKESESCPFLGTYEGQATYRKLISIDQDGNPQYLMFEVDTMTSGDSYCESTSVRNIEQTISQICLETVEAVCQGNFEKCNGYQETIKNNSARVEALAKLLEENKTNATVLLQNRLTPGLAYSPEKKHEDVDAQIELTEDEEFYYIKISAEDRSPIFSVRKKSGEIYLHDKKSREEAKSLGVHGLEKSVSATIDAIIEQMGA